jgi:hypothetical protein
MHHAATPFLCPLHPPPESNSLSEGLAVVDTALFLSSVSIYHDWVGCIGLGTLQIHVESSP